MRRFLLGVFAGVLTFPFAPARAADARPVIGPVSTTATAMNPSLGDSVQVAAGFARPGNVTVIVVDRDGFPVRTLADGMAVAAGTARFAWDGRNDSGAVVPDEAYSFRIEWSSGDERLTYFPADGPSPMVSVDADYYTTRTATLSYTLPAPSRIHIQAGTARPHPNTGELQGPVMKTIVNRAPRAAGKIAEPWNGRDESGTINVADLRDFVVAIAATPLPENSVITYGHPSEFAEAAVLRGGKSLFTHQSASHDHHAGLSVLDDVSPGLSIEPLNASWSAEDRVWRVKGATLELRIVPTGPSAPAFAKQPGQLYAFVDGAEVAKRARPAAYPAVVEIRLPEMDEAAIVTLNWRSEFGAVAANSVRVQRAHTANGSGHGASR